MIVIGFAIGFEQFTDEGTGALAHERDEKQPGQQYEGDIHPPQLFVVVGSEIRNHSRYLGQSIHATPQKQRHPDDAGTEQQCRTPTVQPCQNAQGGEIGRRAGEQKSQSRTGRYTVVYEDGYQRCRPGGTYVDWHADEREEFDLESGGHEVVPAPTYQCVGDSCQGETEQNPGRCGVDHFSQTLGKTAAHTLHQGLGRLRCGFGVPS